VRLAGLPLALALAGGRLLLRAGRALAAPLRSGTAGGLPAAVGEPAAGCGATARVAASVTGPATTAPECLTGQAHHEHRRHDGRPRTTPP
jgi:hypothetical protein